MRRQWMFLLTLGLMVSLALPVRAAEDLGEIRVMLDFGDGEVSGGEVILYYAGAPDKLGYRLTEDFGGGLVKQEDALSGALAQWLAESGEGTGTLRPLAQDGTVRFGRLAPGLYLLVQSRVSPGLDQVPPLLVTVPYENQWQVIALPQYQAVMTYVPKTGDPMWVVFGAMGMVASGLGLLACLEGRKGKRK